MTYAGRRTPALVLLLTAALLFFSAAGKAEEGTEPGRETKIVDLVSEAAVDSLVLVRLELREPRDRLPSFYQALPVVSRWGRSVSNRVPVFGTGVLVGRDAVLMDEPAVLPEMVKRIEISFFDGEKIEAHLDALLASVGLWKLGLAHKRGKPGVAFDKDYEPRFGDPLFAARLKRFDDGSPAVEISPFTWYVRTTGSYLSLAAGLAGSLVFNSEGRPVGFLPAGGAKCLDGRTNWLGRDISASREVPVSAFARLRARMGGLVGKEILPVRFERRGKKAGEADPVRLGIALDGNGTVIVPSFFNAAEIKNIKAIHVERNGKEEKAEFVGQLKNYSALLVRVPSVDAPSALIRTDSPPEPFSLGAALFHLDASGKPLPVVLPVRISKRERLFDGGTYYAYPSSDKEAINPEAGSFIFDLGCGCRGLVLVHFMLWNNGEPAGSPANRSNIPAEKRFSAHFVPFSLLQTIAAAPSKYIVENLRPMGLHEAKKNVWIGVELQNLTEKLAEYLGILAETKYGRIGGRVVWVYPDSPAARAGLRPGDVILRVKRKDGSAGFEIERRMMLFGNWWRSYPWPDRRSVFHERLASLGVDVPLVLDVFRDGKLMQVELKAEVAPEDFLAARSWKCFELGFRVKNMTYEVRRFFQLPADFKGVIVYKVESGSKAEVAEMSPFDIIVRVNKRPVANVEDIKRIVLAALEDDSPSVNFEILRLGETRFLEVKKPTPEEIKQIREEHKFETDDDE